MSDEIQNFRIKYIVDDSQLTESRAEIKATVAEGANLEKEFKDVNKAANDANKEIQEGFGKSKKAGSDFGLSVGGIGKLIAGAFAVDQLINFQKQVIEITAKFQKYEAVLTNTLGSNSLAQKALRDIQEFAAKTPFSVDELTASYVKLANQGFIPTTAELTKLGDLASSTGKSFDQLSEAILDAQSGQFERLKEFGIKASKNGDDVSFSFKGVKTTVDNTSESIQKYILSLGDLKGVSGSMAAISGTLEGQISNLGDSYDALQLSIGRQQSGGLSQVIGALNSLLQETTNAVNGQSSIFDRLIVTVKALSAPFIDLVRAVASVGEKFGLIKSGGAAVETVFFLIEKSVKIATLPLRAFIATVITLIDLVTLNFDQVGKDFQKLGEIIILTDGNENSALQKSFAAIQKKIQLEKDLAKAEEERLAKERKAAEDRKKLTEDQLKEIEKKFKADLAYTKLKEDLAIREAKLLGATQEDIINIERSYNNQRIEIYRAYGRSKGLEFQGLVIKEEEFLKQIRDLNTQSERDILKDKIDADQKVLDEEEKIRAERIKRIRQESDDRSKALKKAADEEIELAKKTEEEKKALKIKIEQETVQLVTTIGNGFFDLRAAKLSTELNDLQKKKDEEIAAYGKTEIQKAAINKKYADQEAQIKRQQAVADKEKAIFNILISTAQNVVKAFPNPVLIALAAALGATQVALVAAKPIPKFFKGVEKLTGEGTETSDSIMARLSVGERVVTAKDNKDYFPALSAIHNHKIPASAMNAFVMDYNSMRRPVALRGGDYDPELKSELKSINKTLKNLPVAQIHLDKNGLRSYLRSGDSETEFLNNYFKN